MVDPVQEMAEKPIADIVKHIGIFNNDIDHMYHRLELSGFLEKVLFNILS